MSSRDDYGAYYLELGLTPGDDFNVLKARYRKLVNKWHPDKSSGVDPIEAEEKIRRINVAYGALTEYFREHGSLPFEEAAAKPDEAVGGHPEFTREAAARSTPRENPAERRVRQVKKGVATGIALLLTIIFISYGDPENEQSLPAEIPPPSKKTAVHKSEKKVTPEPMRYKLFTYGDSFGRVVEVQGKPDIDRGNVWYYGESMVIFKDGKVVDWKSHPASPLYTSITSKKRKELIRLGSSKDTVLDIQGVPDSKTNEAWVYGSSRIYFKNNQVTHWVDSPMNPLKVEMSL